MTAIIRCLLLIAALAIQIPPATASEVKTMRVAGFDMAYVEQGKGPLLMLIHGSFSDHRAWQRQIDTLARDFRVVAPTMRYFGKSDWSDAWPAFSNELFADDLAELIKALGAGPAHLAGWSRGAEVVHLIALKHPAVVRSAYLFEGVAPIRMNEADTKAVQAFGARAFGPAIKILNEQGAAASLPAWIDAVGGPGAYDKYGAADRTRLNENARTIPLMVKSQKVLRDCDVFKASQVPTTLVLGTRSTLLPLFKAVQNCMPERVSIVEGATHLWPGDDVEAFTRSLKSFASGH